MGLVGTLALINAGLAQCKGRSGLAWFFVSLFLGPVATFLILLLDHGADINAVDDEYRSTPLGFASRWGKREIAALLLERGADPNKAGASWSTPLAWAQKKGHRGLASDLIAAGAHAS